jgi:hypothetical protein
VRSGGVVQPSIRPASAGLYLCALAALVTTTHPQAARADGLLAEAAFLADTLPPGTLDLGMSVTVARGEAPEGGGERPVVTRPRVEVTLPLVGERLGLVADVGLVGSTHTGQGVELDTPSVSLRYALRPAGPDTLGVSLSADLYGSTHALADTEYGFNLGALRGLGALTGRATLGMASGVHAWEPHLHGGLSLAFEPLPAWTVLTEAVGTWALHAHEGEAQERTLSLAPALKRALGERTSVMASALVGVAGTDRGSVTGLFALTVSL